MGQPRLIENKYIETPAYTVETDSLNQRGLSSLVQRAILIGAQEESVGDVFKTRMLKARVLKPGPAATLPARMNPWRAMLLVGLSLANHHPIG